jgi:hypothetical protein
VEQVAAGRCLSNCGATGTACHVSEDCPENDFCFATYESGGTTIEVDCTDDNPCNGQCSDGQAPGYPIGLCEGSQGSYACPSWCMLAVIPHNPACPGIPLCLCTTCPEVTPDSGVVGCVGVFDACTRDADCCSDSCWDGGRVSWCQ